MPVLRYLVIYKFDHNYVSYLWAYEESARVVLFVHVVSANLIFAVRRADFRYSTYSFTPMHGDQFGHVAPRQGCIQESLAK